MLYQYDADEAVLTIDTSLQQGWVSLRKNM